MLENIFFSPIQRELLEAKVNIKDLRLEKFIIEAFTYVNNLNLTFKNIKIKKLFIFTQFYYLRMKFPNLM